MPYETTWECAGIKFDIFSSDSEKVPIGLTDNKYFLIESRLPYVEAYLIENDLDLIRTPEQFTELLSKGIIQEY